MDVWAHMQAYWSGDEIATNGLIFLNLMGALLLGGLVGYERAYHGRAAGMRTYGLVCMASAALTLVAGYPAQWFGGLHAVSAVPDPTRIIQGVVTGVGFLGAGVIMKEGLNISGLTTAASIWAASCIGVLLGVGFYAAAILLAGLCAATMMWGARLEGWLPSHPALHVRLGAPFDLAPRLAAVDALLMGLGYRLAPGSTSFSHQGPEWDVEFVAVVERKHDCASMEALGQALSGLAGVTRWHLRHARN